MSTVVFGIPNCDTVKKARRFLEQYSIDYTFSDLRGEPPTSAQLQHWADSVGLDNLVNKRSTTYRQLTDAEKNGQGDAHWIALLDTHPTLIKRPVLQHNGSVTVGFKEATYRELLGV